MTEIYDTHGIGPALDLTCPVCNGRSQFTGKFDMPLPVPVKNPNGASTPIPSWEGMLTCGTCGTSKTHHVTWPQEAFYQIDYRGQTLWAETEAMLRDMLSFIDAGAERKMARRDSRYYVKLLHLPAHFLSAKARAAVVKKMKALLEK